MRAAPCSGGGARCAGMCVNTHYVTGTRPSPHLHISRSPRPQLCLQSPVIPLYLLYLATCEAEDSVAEQSATAITRSCVVYMWGEARPGQARGSMNNVEICRRDN